MRKLILVLPLMLLGACENNPIASCRAALEGAWTNARQDACVEDVWQKRWEGEQRALQPYREIPRVKDDETAPAT